MTEYVVVRDVTSEECHWLSQPVLRGTVVYRCVKPDYGCVGAGVAMTLNSDGDYPFFELPRDSFAVSMDLELNAYGLMMEARDNIVHDGPPELYEKVDALIAAVRHESAERIRQWEREAQTLLPLERGAAKGAANLIESEDG